MAGMQGDRQRIAKFARVNLAITLWPTPSKQELALDRRKSFVQPRVQAKLRETDAGARRTPASEADDAIFCNEKWFCGCRVALLIERIVVPASENSKQRGEWRLSGWTGM